MKPATIPETIRQMLADWDNATDGQRAEALAAAEAAATTAEQSLNGV